MKRVILRSFIGKIIYYFLFPEINHCWCIVLGYICSIELYQYVTMYIEQDTQHLLLPSRRVLLLLLQSGLLVVCPSL